MDGDSDDGDRSVFTGRNMREARDTAVAERDRLQVSEREVEVKCEQVVRQ